MERIVLAVDGSDHSMKAAELAGELSSRFNALVDVLNVVRDDAPIVPGAVHEYAQLEKLTITQRDLMQSAGSEVTEMAKAKVEAAGGEVAQSEVRVGTPSTTIVAFADAVGADCIVMGRRGMGDFKGLLVGSVSHRVGHQTNKTLITTE